MGVERVSDVDDPRLADYRDLKDGARRRRDGTFIAESRQVVRRLLGGSRFRARSVLAAEAAAEDLRDVLTGGLPVYVAPEATLQRVVGFNLHRGCRAVRARGAERALEGLRDARVLLVLEGVTNPDNIGGAFRNAMAFGVGGVVLAPRCSDPLYRKAIRVSMGGTLVVPFAAAASWPDALVRLRERGFTIVALTPDGGWVPADLLAESVEAGDGLFRLRGVAWCEEVPDVGMSSDQRQDDLRAHPTDQDRRMRALHRLRVTRCVLQLVVLARERRLVLGEERLHHLHRLDQAAGSFALVVERDRVGGVLGLEPGGAHAQDQASVAHLIDGRRHLGEHRRVSVGVAGHEHADLHVLRLRREGGEQRPALQARTGLPVDGHEMIERERRVEAELVARLPATQDVVVRRMLGPRLYAEAYRPGAGGRR